MDMRINSTTIGEKQPVFVIAEAGVNHNGDVKLAKKMIDIAVKAKANAIKFQTFKTENVMIRNTPKAAYQVDDDRPGENFFDMSKGFELPFEAFRDLKNYCDKKGIIFISTPFCFDSVDFLAELDVPAFKVSSGDFVNYPFLEHIITKGKPIFVSSGTADADEVRETMEFFRSKKFAQVVLFHCTSSYPTSLEDLNLNVIDAFKRDYSDILIGFSDHSPSTITGALAVAKCAKVIEKHFTADKQLPGPDHKASLDPVELKIYIENIRAAETALGSPVKRLTDAERNVRDIARKSVVTKIGLKKGTMLSRDNLTVKRPGTGIPAKLYYQVLGKKTKRDIDSDSLITWNDIE